MIRAVMVMNTQGKPRLAKFYDYQPVEKQQELIRSIFGVLCSRAENVSNFIEAEAIFGPDTRLVYKHYATLYFVFIFDSSENELAMLDLIQELMIHSLKNEYLPAMKWVVDLEKQLKFKTITNYTADPVVIVSVFVETLDKCFKNVCELDIIFNFNKMHTILDEIVLGGQVLETSAGEVMKAVDEITKLEKSSDASVLIPKSVSSRLSR